MIVARRRAELADARATMDKTVAFVPTLGALHDGHIANFRAARERADHVAVSIFVNPLQFGPNEDFARYPRQDEADLRICEDEGVDLVFLPSQQVMYPRPVEVRMDPGGLGEILEGASRPGFFGGVMTVVSKLFHLVRPDVACFGEKDYQQLAVIRRMVSDLDMGIDIVGVPTVRETDGLALSSRNVYLDAEERRAALAIPRALAGARESPDPLGAAQAVINAQPGLRPDYVALTDPDLGPAPEAGPGRLFIAAWAGDTRLIDNAPVHVGVS